MWTLDLWPHLRSSPLSVPADPVLVWTQGDDQATARAHVVTEREYRTHRRLAAQQDREKLTR
ncbi:hypothetical protein [Deinococcus hohokamensis]|uniref:Uncharacterized protein n=1 Tax=Deinococcus hohokamensis TaxID=309883 RepID=A0ABV9IEJ7_9DEIO